MPRQVALRDRTSWSIAAAFFVATLARGVGQFRYDALYYWWGAQQVVGSIPGAPDDFWPLRGVLTAWIYAPAALVARFLGQPVAPATVLVENSLLLAVVAAFLVPAAAQRGRRAGDVRARWILGGVLWLLTAGFAPFPLMDIWAAAGCLLLVVLIRRREWWALMSSGAVAGVVLNLRPAYLVAVIALGVFVVVRHRWRAVFVVPGVLLALLPQFVENLSRFPGSLAPWPPASVGLMNAQAAWASWVVRYDTLFGADPAGQFFCSPAMAQRVSSDLPVSSVALGLSFLRNVPTSIVFSSEKLASALHWPLSTPYTVPVPVLDGLFALFVTAVTVLGLGYLLLTRSSSSCATARRDVGPVLAMAGASVVAIVGSAAESRFALPVVLAGASGLFLLLQREGTPRFGKTLTISVLVVVMAAAVVGGYAGLSSPMAPGVFGVTACGA
ncbi:MAG: hypothetical protein J0I87_10095 [Cellulomonas sp.]|nr:hypothetical protein [Cellulomonas sp.]